MSIASRPSAAAGTPRRVTALLVGLPLLVTLLGGCGQRMALKVNGEVVSQDQFYKQCANFTQDPLHSPTVGLIMMEQGIFNQLLEQEARRLKLVPTDAEVNS